MNYVLTLPIAGIICFGFGFLFGQPALRLSGVISRWRPLGSPPRCPQLLKLGFFEHWTGGVQGSSSTHRDGEGPADSFVAIAMIARPELQ